MRTIAVFCLALAVMFIVMDATRSVGVSELVTTPFAQSWNAFLPDSFASFANWSAQNAPAFVNEYVLETILEWPTFVVFGILAALAYVLAHKRRRRLTNF